MKKSAMFVSLTLAAAMTFALAAGCGEQKGGGGGGTRFTGDLESERGAVVKVMDNGTAIEKGVAKAIIDAFNEEYAEYGIRAEDANMDQTDLAQDGPYGYGPDVLFGANDTLMPYAANKHILPLPVETLECYDKISENAWSAYVQEVDGTEYTFGVPVIVQSPVLYYRKDLLPENWQETWDDDKDGVPDVVQYMDDLYEYAVQIKEESKGGRLGISYSAMSAYSLVGFLYTFGGYTFGDNNTDPADIGHANGDAEKGAYILRQLASVMDERCVDESMGLVAYDNVGDGTFFSAINTPDTYSLFTDAMVVHGMTREEAEENLGVAAIPKLPASGDLTKGGGEYLDTKMMGGVNGWAISSYTDYPNACLAFVEFASNYESAKLRCETLGAVAARSDVSSDTGGLSSIVNGNLEKGNIIIQPSIKEVEQIWTPLTSLFTDIALDPYRKAGEQKYNDLPSLKRAIENCDQQIYDAIFTLA